MDDYFSKNGVHKFYQYKEMPRDKKTVEFGWMFCSSLDLSNNKLVVVSKSPDQPDTNSAVILSDYEKYFTSFTGFSSERFLARWKNSPSEFEKYWKEKKPESEPGTHLFLMGLAYLIQEKTSFEHKFSNRLVTFEVVDVENESGSKD